ncbi:hypothetical protein HYU07_00250 [Candidatus Woesearchaeota archaeon]|nr:hypothetical protein [Candidatus Woesearchaeota archaeon]
MKNKTIIRVVIIVMFLLIINKFVSAEYVTYTIDSGSDVFCNDADDTRLSCEDIGSGSNHGCDEIDPNGCHPFEGPAANYGEEACRITCANIGCTTPDVIDTKACPSTSCGNQTRNCLGNYTWSDWSECPQEAGNCSASCASQGFYWDTTKNQCCGDDATDNPDLNEGSCLNCPIGGEAANPSLRAWSSTASACCGDDSGDMGYRTSDNSIICANSTWQWLKADDCRGDVINVSNTMYVSKDGVWTACPGFTNIDVSKTPSTTTQSHGFICSNNASGAYNIYECKGNDQAYSDGTGAPICRGTSEGVRNKTGDSVRIDQTTYYCIDTGDKKIWSNNLDDSSGSCESAGFSYTGSLCCGEDPHEDYNDVMNPNPNTNCWDEREITNNTILSSNELFKNSGLTEWVDADNLKYWLRTGEIEAFNGGATRSTAAKLISGASIESDFIPVSGDVEYRSIYYYSGNINAKIKQYDASKNFVSDALQNSVTQATGWALYNSTYTPTQQTYYIKLFLSAASGQTAYFDDVSLKGGENIMTLNGQFYGCNIPAGLQTKQDTQHTGNLIINDGYCTNRGRFYCDYSSEWLDNNGQMKNHTSASPSGLSALATSYSSAGCCQDSQCWNGTSCVDDQAGNPLAQAYENKRCLSGEWKDDYQKKTWNNEAGYCPEKQQCLVNPSGSYASNNNPDAYFTSTQPQCINNTQYVLDHYCENGNWTTRTKQLALTMINLAGSSEYALFCDNYANVLNYYNYIISGTKNAQDYISNKCTFGSQVNQPCANQVCILNYNNNILFGLTVNQELNAPNYKFLDVLSLSGCTATNDGQFHSCDASNKIWYNNASKTLIYSNAAFSMPTTLTQAYLKTLSLILLGNPILALHQLINSIILPSFDFGGNLVSFDYSFINQTKDFSHLYMLKTTDKSIFALIEENILDATGVSTKYLVINYTGFGTNICDDYVNKTNKYICYKDNNKFYIAAKPFADKVTDAVFNLWRDFTSKLRIAGTGGSIDMLYAIADTG